MTEPRHDVIDVQTNGEKLQSLATVGTVSYVLHLIVAVAALVPGGQVGPILLIVALIIDMVKRSDAEGTWHASHFRWRIRTVLVAALLYAVTLPLWFLFFNLASRRFVFQIIHNLNVQECDATGDAMKNLKTGS